MGAKTTVAVLLLLALSVCVLAQQEELSLLDVTRGFKGTTVKPSSYGGYSVIQSCLEMSQLKDCAVIGNICSFLPASDCCASDTKAEMACLDGPSGAYVETDFTCCGDRHDYGYGSKTTLGEVYINGRAATCQWQIDALKDFSKPQPQRSASKVPPVNYICLHDDPTSPHCKLGPVSGHCQFTDESDKCEGPYCHDMAITFRGHLYGTLAYSKERSNTLATNSPRCTPVANFFNMNSMSDVSKGEDLPFDPSASGGPFALLLAALAQAALAELQPVFDAATSGLCSDRTSTDQTEHPADHHYKHEDMYAGAALVIMGETSIASLKSPLKVEETGHIEFAPVFSSLCSKRIPADQKWPTVRGGAMKLWFKEEDKGHPEHRY